MFLSRLLIVVSVTTLVSCAPLVMIPHLSSDSLLNLPVSTHDREIEIFFSGVSFPARPFLQLKYLSHTRVGAVEINDMLHDLKKEAASIGADGIIVINSEKRISQVYTMDYMANVYNTDIYALAYVYPENLTYHDGIVKAFRVYNIDINENWTLAGSVLFNQAGRFSKIEGQRDIVRRWFLNSHEFLFDNQYLSSFRKEANRYTHRKYNLFDSQSRIFYNDPNPHQIRRIDIKRGVSTESRIRYHYESPRSAEVTHRVIKLLNIPELSITEFPEYRPDGFKSGYSLVSDFRKERKPYLKVDIEYYSKEEWEQALAEIIEHELGTIQGESDL